MQRTYKFQNSLVNYSGADWKAKAYGFLPFRKNEIRVSTYLSYHCPFRVSRNYGKQRHFVTDNFMLGTAIIIYIPLRIGLHVVNTNLMLTPTVRP